jgi:hypothetical protein
MAPPITSTNALALRLVQAACALARLVMISVPAGELRPLMALETAEAWVFGAAPIEAGRRAPRLRWPWDEGHGARSDRRVACGPERLQSRR